MTPQEQQQQKIFKYKEMIFLFLAFLCGFIIKMRTRKSYFGDYLINFKILLILKSLSNVSDINSDYFKLYKLNVTRDGEDVFINAQSLSTVFPKDQRGIWSSAWHFMSEL